MLFQIIHSLWDDILHLSLAKTECSVTYLQPLRRTMGGAGVNHPMYTKVRAHPNMTAFQSMILLSCGAPLIPAGGSCCNLLKSLISLFLAGVDILNYR